MEEKTIVPNNETSNKTVKESNTNSFLVLKTTDIDTNGLPKESEVISREIEEKTREII